MRKKIDYPLNLIDPQTSMEFSKDGDYHVAYVGETPDGFGLFKRVEPHGGFSYHSTEVPLLCPCGTQV